MRDRPTYRYTDAEMDAIRRAIQEQDPDWLDTIWDPITIHFHGKGWHDLAVRGTIEGRPDEFGVPWDQSQQIGRWLGELPRATGMRAGWLIWGPTPVDDDEPPTSQNPFAELITALAEGRSASGLAGELDGLRTDVLAGGQASTIGQLLSALTEVADRSSDLALVETLRAFVSLLARDLTDMPAGRAEAQRPDGNLARALRRHAEEHLDQWDAFTWESSQGPVWALISRRPIDAVPPEVWVELSHRDGVGDDE